MASIKEESNLLTVEDVIKCIQNLKHELKWNELAFQFSLSDAEQAEIESCTSEGNDRYEEVIKRWLSGGGLKPDWRSLIWILDGLDEMDVADQVRSHAEPTSDPTFTIENICSVMASPDWKELWTTLVPESRLNKIERDHLEVEARTHACAVVYSSHREASWQQLAHSLYLWNHLSVLEKVKGFLPPKDVDESLTTENTVSVMSLVTHEDWKFIWHQLIPEEQLDVIDSKSSSPEERTRLCCKHYLSRCPTASWPNIARILYRNGESSAMEKAKIFLPPKDSTLTVDNVKEVFKGFQDWDSIVYNLDMADSVVSQILGSDSDEQKVESVFKCFVHDHPCPSWSILVEGLECLDQYRLANQLRAKYIDTES